MSGAAAVLALVMLECATGVVAVAAWTQSWSVVRRGHFRSVAWSGILLALLAFSSNAAALDDTARGIQPALVTTTAVLAVLYLLAQYAHTDRPGAVVGAAAGASGVAALIASAGLLDEWPLGLASLGLVAGAILLGAVVNGMLLGHWYLNQPGLKPGALARLTTLGLAAVAVSTSAGLVAVSRLARASTEGAVLGLPGFGASFGWIFFGIWIALAAFTGAVVAMARRCVSIRSIQSATGLYYVAVLTAGVAEFLVRYLMVNSRG